MHPGDIGFILAFIVLPLVIVVLSISAIRVVRRRATPPPPLPEEPIEPRDWAASVRPTRSAPASLSQIRPFRTPDYRGKPRGSTRRINAAALRRQRPDEPTER